MHYVGIDYHKKYSHVAAVNQEGHVVCSERLNNSPDEFQKFFDRLDGPSRTVVEASRTWGVMYDLLEESDGVESVTLAHPLKVRAIAEAKVKTDKIDAETLAQLLRADLIPAAYIPRKETRQFKEIIRQRIFLVRLRTKLKNRIHVLLDRLHIPLPPVSDVFGKKGTAYLKKLRLEGVDGEILRENLLLLEALDGLIQEAEKEIEALVGDDPRVCLLRTIPGLGPVLAAVVAMEIDDVSRFRTPAKLASYSGIVPTTYASGGRLYHGRLIPTCNKWLRWALIEAAWVAMRVSPYCRGFYEKRRSRKNPNTAAVALARRLGEIVWHVLKENRVYEERPLQSKNQSLRKDASPAALIAS
jgi:transposase